MEEIDSIQFPLTVWKFIRSLTFRQLPFGILRKQQKIKSSIAQTPMKTKGVSPDKNTTRVSPRNRPLSEEMVGISER